MKKELVVFVLLIVVSAAAYFLFNATEGLLDYANEEYAQMQAERSPASNGAGEEDEANEPPLGLALPVRIADLGQGGNVMVSPFGIVRRESVDRLDFGHGGIDLPIPPGSDVFAVADGVVIKKRHGTDMSAGQGGEIWISLGQDGWTFLYEHIEPREDLFVGDHVSSGEVLGANAMDTVFATVHFQLTNVFDERLYTRDSRCWIDYLTPGASEELLNWFDGQRETMRDLWAGIMEEGYSVHEGLLDLEVYSSGPQMCYPPGTDGRRPLK